MQDKQQINQEIEHIKEAFYGNGFAVFGQGTEILIDFRQTLPRDDETPNGIIRSIVAKHQPIVISPQVAKMLLTILKEQLENVEKAIGGEIKLPPNWRAQPQNKNDKGSSTTETYIR